jgi:hypothetical protein
MRRMFIPFLRLLLALAMSATFPSCFGGARSEARIASALEAEFQL